MIRLGQDSVLEVRVLIKEKIELEPFWFFNPVPLDVFEILESSFIPLSYLEYEEQKTSILRESPYKKKKEEYPKNGPPQQ